MVMGDDTAVGDYAVLYSLGTITLGRFVTISQYAHLCAGTHDTRSRLMSLLRQPINIGEDCWIAADAFVGPGVTIGDRTVVGARASVFSDLPADVIAVGNPARPIKRREFREPGPDRLGAPSAACPPPSPSTSRDTETDLRRERPH
jgi:putative colanic acid biosynthesis acetyltransferase WcaF